MRIRAFSPYLCAVFVLGPSLNVQGQGLLVEVADRPAGVVAPSDGVIIRAPRADRRYAERVVVIDPTYTPGNPRCYLKREVADGPYGPVLIYRPVC